VLNRALNYSVEDGHFELARVIFGPVRGLDLVAAVANPDWRIAGEIDRRQVVRSVAISEFLAQNCKNSAR